MNDLLNFGQAVILRSAIYDLVLSTQQSNHTQKTSLTKHRQPTGNDSQTMICISS